MNRKDLNPEIWGPKAWFFLDSAILSYPDNPTDNIKNSYKTFIISLKDILPCTNCREHFIKYINTNPLTDKILSSRIRIQEWILNLHNNINKFNNKDIITYKNYINYYNKIYKNSCKYKCQSNVESFNEYETYVININKNHIALVKIIIIFILLITIIYTYKK